MQKIYEELARIQWGQNAGLSAEDDAKKMLDAVNTVNKLAQYSRRAGWINIDRALNDPEITSAPLYSELKFIIECFLYEGEGNRDFPEFDEDDIWTYYYSGTYTGTDAFIYLYYIYMTAFIKEENNPRFLSDLSAFLMPDCVRELLPNNIEEQKVSHEEYKKQYEQRKQDTENIDFDKLKAEWLEEGRAVNEDFAFLDFVIRNLTDGDLKAFAAAHTEKPSALGLLDAVSGNAANRFYGTMSEGQKNTLESKFREYPYMPRLWEVKESTALLLKLMDEGKITIPGAAVDFSSVSVPYKAKAIKDDSIKNLFYRIEEGGIIALAKVAPYVLANSSLFEDEKIKKRIEKTLPDYILNYLGQKRQKNLDLSEIIDNDKILCEKIAEMAQKGTIRVNTSRYSIKERR